MSVATDLPRKAYFITVEGIEGAGKSTALRFMQQHLHSANIAHVVTREPGGTEIAEHIRQLLLKPHQEAMVADTELLLMFAGRAQHLAQVIKPALAAQKWVLCDRFTDATYAYQGGGRGIASDRIQQIEQWVQNTLRPDCVLLLDVPVAIGLERIRSRRTEDRIEQEKSQFFERVRQAYLERAANAPERYKIVDASLSWPNVRDQLCHILDELIAMTTEAQRTY